MPLIQPTGHWVKSTRHRVAWALGQVLAKRRDDQQRRSIAAWQWRLTRAIKAALDRVDWDAWARKHLRVVDEKLEPARKRVAKDLEFDPGFDEEDLPDFDMDEVEGMVRKLYTEAGKNAWKLQKPEAGGSVALPFPEEQFNAAMREAFENVTGVGKTSKGRMRSLMRETMDESKTFSDFARKLRREFPALSARRAGLIAGTEYNNAASEATLLLYKEQGIKRIQWNSVGDEKVCDECLANEGQGPINTGDEFQSGVTRTPQHPACRCNISSGEE